MENRRLSKIQDVYFHEVTRLVRFEMEEPKLAGARITRVRVTPDLTLARIYFDLPGGKKEEKEVVRGFLRSKNFLKRSLAKTLPLKRVPDLQFFYDETDDLNSRMEELFREMEQKIESIEK